MKQEKRTRPIFWVGSSKKDLKQFPDEVQKTFGYALWQAQNGAIHLDAKVLKGFGGAGVLEVVANHVGSTFRAVYTVKLAGWVYVLHAFQKKSKKGVKTPKQEIDLIKRRLKNAEEHYDAWKASQQEKAEAERNG